MPRVVVALCTYNGAAFVREQLDSLAAQTRLPDELLVCDDRSTDGTLDLVREFAKGAPFRVRAELNPENLGMTRNFSRAVDLADGDIIFLCDHDDRWLPDKIERLTAALDRDPRAALVFGDSTVVDQDLKPLGYSMWEAHRFGPRDQRRFRKDPLRTLERHNVVTGSACAFRREVRDLATPIPRGWVHDHWIALMATMVGDLVPVPGPTMLYRQHGRNQIGAQHVSPYAAVEHARDGATEFARDRDRWALALAHMRSVAPRARSTATLRRIEDKVAHLDARVALPSARGARLRPVMREVATGRYRRHSRGILSAAKDLLR